MPTGPGIGATQLVWAVMSSTRAAGKFPIRTVGQPKATMPGPAGTHAGRVHGVVLLVTLAAGWLPIRTVKLMTLDVNVMKIKPPIVFSISQADILLGALKQVFREDMMQLT